MVLSDEFLNARSYELHNILHLLATLLITFNYKAHECILLYTLGHGRNVKNTAIFIDNEVSFYRFYTIRVVFDLLNVI